MKGKVVVGLICVVLIACLVITIVACESIIRSRDSTIFSLNSRVIDLNFEVSKAKAMMDMLVSVSVTPVSLEEISMNTSAWLNRTVIIGGNLTGPYAQFSGPFASAYNYMLDSNGTTFKVLSPIYPYGYTFQSFQAVVLGIVTENYDIMYTDNGTITLGQAQYIISAERIYTP